MTRLEYLQETPSQTAGPYVHIGLAPGAAGFDIYEQELGRDIAGPNAKGQRIRVEGCVYDGTGSPVKDVLLETWQANREGHYAHAEGGGPVEEGFRGWGGLSRILPPANGVLTPSSQVQPKAGTGGCRRPISCFGWSHGASTSA